MSREHEPAPVMERAGRIHKTHLRENPWGITPAEAQVLDLMCAGLLQKQIADQLGIERKSVEVSAATARRRMGYYGHSIVPYLLWDRWRTGRANAKE